MSGGGQVLSTMFAVKATFLFLLVVVDIFINAMAEYEQVAAFKSLGSTIANMIMIIFQIGALILSFVTMFMLLGSTFLFQGGLLGVLYSRFRPLVWSYPIYFTACLALGIWRIQLWSGMSEEKQLEDLWDNDGYFAFSVVHKLIAVCYYVLNVRATLALGESRYYTKEEWVTLYRRATGGASSRSLGSSVARHAHRMETL